MRGSSPPAESVALDDLQCLWLAPWPRVCPGPTSFHLDEEGEPIFK